MHDTVALIEARISRSYSQRVARATHTDHVPVTVEAWDVPDEPIVARLA